MAFKFNVSGGNVSQQKEFILTAIQNMYAKHVNPGQYSILLTGDPGTGKTSSVKQLATLLGMELLTIEAPHVLEEHLVKIPFIVFDPKTKSSKTMTDVADVQNTGEGKEPFKVVYSHAYLAQELNKKVKIPDAEYLDYIYKQDKTIITLFEAMGGSQETIPPKFIKVRSYFNKILFIDEYFRTDGPKIRNIFRRILNGMLGDSKLPPGTFTIFASNMNDEGLDEISGHQVFEEFDMEARTKNEWFSWLVDKFSDDNKGVNLNEDVINKFYDILKDEHISFNDIKTDIRTSPRRWEQILLYVNSSLPAKNAKDAGALLANVKSMFSNKDGVSSALMEPVLAAVKELIAELSPSIGKDIEPLNETDWEITFKHQIQQKMKLGKHRTYVPVISGSPGIGKTQQIKQVAEELGLKLIYIDATSINKEDVIGMPIAGEIPKKGSTTSFEFSAPRMLHMIEEEIQDKIEKQIKNTKGKTPDSEWKYLLFIDELDKVPNKTVFNAIRKVLLEKEFSTKYTLPEGTIVASAINPSGVEGSHDFTGHVSDVIDVINAKPNWKKTIKHFDGVTLHGDYKKWGERIISVLSIFANKFKSSGKSAKEFNINVGHGESVYFSPRDYEDILHLATIGYGFKVEEIEDSEEPDLTVFNKDIRESIFKPFSRVLGPAFRKSHVDPTDFMSDLHSWFISTKELDFLSENITTKYKKALTSESLKKPLEKLMKDMNYNLLDDKDFVSYINGISLTDFARDLREFVDEDLLEGGEKEFELHKPIHNYVDPEDGTAMITTVDGLRKYYKMLERDFSTLSKKEPKDRDKDKFNNIKELLKEFKPYSEKTDEELKKFFKSNDLSYKIGKAHAKTYDLFKGEKTEEFVNKVKEAVDDIGMNHAYIENVDRVLGGQLEKLEKRYLGDHIKPIEIH